MMNKTLTRILFALLILTSLHTNYLWADGPKDNNPLTVRRIPQLGIEISVADRAEFETGLKKLNASLQMLRKKKDARTKSLLPDVEIFYRAVHDVLTYQEFFSKRDVSAGKRVMLAGQLRADQLLKGEAPWTTASGLVVRGFRSELDDTVQPYGLVIPENFNPKANDKEFRCDLWFHGRGERLSEVSFIDQRMRSGHPVKPKNTIVLHPYGRYSNAFKFAGEVDVLEALNSAGQNYPIDDDRVSVRGFSMGGAGCWQMAVHYPDLFFACHPGAGFSETPLFLKSFQKETLKPTWFEKKLWQWYDCPGYAANLYHCPTIAYSGELDTQKQAADVMEVAMKKVGINMLHMIGPQQKHRMHPEVYQVIEQKLTNLAKRGRNRVPTHLHFATYTLKYNRMHWLTINRMKEHWKKSQMDGFIKGNVIYMVANNVTDFSLNFEAGDAPFDLMQDVKLQINRTLLVLPKPKSDQSFSCRVYQEGNTWKIGIPKETRLVKKHDLQGPIDDALMSRFIFVKPTGKFQNATVSKWVTSELKRAQIHWRQHFRGHAITKKDTDITDKEIANSNLILWGDPSSNAILKKIADKLPIQWKEKSITVGNITYDAQHHAPIMIFPNPLNPQKYIVLNSSFTYREYAYLNNARQVPMLPDWAIIDLRTPAGTQYPGKIVAADFFDEQWKVKGNAE